MLFERAQAPVGSSLLQLDMRNFVLEAAVSIHQEVPGRRNQQGRTEVMTSARDGD